MDALVPVIEKVVAAFIETFSRGGRVIAFGNGGSAAEAQHLVAELIGRARQERRPLAAIALSADSSTVTALGNDYGFADVFARQVAAHARPGDAVLGISTSGRSENVVRGLAAANAAGATTILLGGAGRGPAASIANIAVLIPSRTVARVQEMHSLVIHLLCERVDEWAIAAGPPPSQR